MPSNLAFRRLAPVALLAWVACSEDTPSTTEPPGPTTTRYELVNAFPALTFIKPIDLQDPRDGSNRLFVADQFGVIHVFENRPDVESSSVFMDLTEHVGQGLFDNGEKGMLSIAFDPDFANNGYFYAYFTSDTNKQVGTHPYESRISRFTVSPPSANTCDPATEEVVLNVPQVEDWHNGGQLAFDNDGYLYLSLGDGGAPRLAQNPHQMLGSILRIDARTLPYSIPEGNAFEDSEIFALGFRNPWRMSIDPVTGYVWVGDVGSNRFEEINVVEAGKNYGWWCREGDFDALITSCPVGAEYTDPVWFYSHAVGTAVVGGYVVRGSALPGLEGRYLCSDYTARELWAIDYDGTTMQHEVLIQDTELNVASFGMDATGNVYMLEVNFLGQRDRIFKVVAVEEPAS